MWYHSTRYFQLTPDVLMEYNYTDIDVADNQSGNKSDYIVDLSGADATDKASVTTNNYTKTKDFCFDSLKTNFVLPVNVSETKFIQCVKNGKFITLSDMNNAPINNLTNNTDDIIYDKFRLHFTSKNYLGDYDGFIIRATIYDTVKNKISLLSYIIKKTDDVVINKDPLLINQKLYTTYIDLKLPSVDGLLNQDKLKGEAELSKLLSPVYPLMTNTPVVFTIYGVKNSYNYNQYECYNVEKINTIFIPVKDSFNTLNVTIEEADDGDYFKLYPEVSDGSMSFSDYIYNVSNGRPETYIVLYEITLTEYYTDYMNNIRSEMTHRGHYIVNAAQAEDTMEVNEEDLDRIMIYRPVLMHSGRLVSFLIECQMKLINTLDNTTVVKIASFDSKENSGCSPKKYGKKLNKIYLGEIPAQINVYNKRPDDDLDSVKITNASSSVKIENHQHSVIGFIECTNVGVSIEQVPIESLE